jgi:23S rRNA (cytosine1962-C5)-methyltransferase
MGMDIRREYIIAALEAQLKPTSIYERSDAGSRRLEGLELRTGLVTGKSIPELVPVRENGLTFRADVTGGQKTGYFLDQKENRRALRLLVPGARVLDAFCHIGSFALHAAHYGASQVTGIDISPEAVALAQQNAELNGVEHTCTFQTANAFDLLRELDSRKEQFDVVILDPPAFAKGRDAIAGAIRGYKEVNLRGIRILKPGGFLITCSCSHHISPEAFWDVIISAAADARRELRLVERRTQCLDHPIIPAIKETEYLKCFIFQVV